MRRLPVLIAMVLAVFGRVANGDVVEFRVGNETKTVEGNVLAEDSFGTILLQSRDNQHYRIPQSDRIRWEKADKVVPFFTKRELREHLEKEFGPEFQVYQTNHYTICYSCEEDYAKQASVLFEKAYAVFQNYFRRRGRFSFDSLDVPLVAVICSSREEYVEMLAPKLGPYAEATSGVYISDTNRMYMYDAFGGPISGKLRVAASVNRQRAQGIALLLKEQNISVIIHEAIHQIAYNVGFHNRQVENPVWLVEGMAMFFESPDLDSKAGWRGVGNVNRDRLAHFIDIADQQPADALRRLVLDDNYFRSSQTGNDAYAEAWAFTYYLARANNDLYIKYLKIINERPPLVAYTPEERLKDFREAFGKEPEEFEEEFMRYMKLIVDKHVK